MAGLTSSWINVLAAFVGGAMLAIGLVRLAVDVSLFGALLAVAGVLLLWWAIGDRRRLQRGTPESEADGRHTIE